MSSVFCLVFSFFECMDAMLKGRLPKVCVAQLRLWQLRCDGDFFACFETACSQSSVRNLRVSLLVGSRQNQIHVRDGGLRRKAPEYSRHFPTRGRTSEGPSIFPTQACSQRLGV